jgi:hypothetical protein
MTVKDEIDEMLKTMTEVSQPEPEPEPIQEPEKEVIKDDSSIGGEGVHSDDRAVTGKESSDSMEEGSKEGSEELSTDRSDTKEDATRSVSAGDLDTKSEPDERDRTIADLRAKLAEREVVKEPVREPPKLPEEQDFIGEVDLDELTRDPKEFNKVLNKIYQKAVVDTRSSVVETLPEIVKTNIQIMNELKATSERFYDENKDLQPFKKVVAVVFDELAASNPNRSYNEIIKDVAPEVRKRLDLKKEVKEPTTKKVESPKLPQKGGRVGRSDKPTLEPLQAELEEMNRVIGR